MLRRCIEYIKCIKYIHLIDPEERLDCEYMLGRYVEYIRLKLAHKFYYYALRALAKLGLNTSVDYDWFDLESGLEQSRIKIAKDLQPAGSHPNFLLRKCFLLLEGDDKPRLGLSRDDPDLQLINLLMSVTWVG